MFHRNRRLAHVFTALLCASFATALLAASPPPDLLPALGPAPVLVVFPFKTGTGIDPADGSSYASIIGKALSDAGGVNVVMGDPATQPADVLHATAALGGDYYLTGSVTAPGRSGTSVLEQLVSRRSGTTVWGANALVSTENDVRDQASVIRGALIAYASRGFYAVVNATPAPQATKEPPKQTKRSIAKGGAARNGAAGEAPRKTLDLPPEAYGFSSAPTAQPEIYASAAHPTRFAIMGITGSQAPDAIERYTENSLVTTLTSHGQPALMGDPEITKHFLMHPQDVCKEIATQFLVFGTIATTSTDPTLGVEAWTDARYTPMIYDCRARAYNRTAKAIRGSGFNWQTAVDRATSKATTDFFSKLGKASAHA
jgi:TolB-like protein